MSNHVEASSTELTPFQVQPLTERCQANFRTRVHACVGISPFNSYFSEQRIADIARWALSTFSDVHLYLPDEPSAYTLEALGYPPEKAAWKARRQSQYLRNKIRRALARLDIEHPDDLVLDSAALSTNKHYNRLNREVERSFATRPEFAAECMEASRWVLDNRLPNGAVATEEQLRSAVRYFLAELPLFSDAAGITGRTNSVFCYHQPVPFLQRLYEGRLDWKPSPRQGFAVVAPAGEDLGSVSAGATI